MCDQIYIFIYIISNTLNAAPAGDLRDAAA